MTAEQAMEKIGAALDDYFRGGNPHDALAAIAQARGEYEGTK